MINLFILSYKTSVDTCPMLCIVGNYYFSYYRVNNAQLFICLNIR